MNSLNSEIYSTVLQRQSDRCRRVDLRRSVHRVWKCRGSSQERLCAINSRLPDATSANEFRSSAPKLSHSNAENAAAASRLPDILNAIQERARKDPQAQLKVRFNRDKSSNVRFRILENDAKKSVLKGLMSGVRRSNSNLFFSKRIAAKLIYLRWFFARRVFFLYSVLAPVIERGE